MVRPKLPDNLRRSRSLPAVRVTAAEYRLLEAAAEARELTLSEYVRETLVRSARRATK
jgi:uncharacterized protein (DUF1778 family)